MNTIFRLILIHLLFFSKLQTPNCQSSSISGVINRYAAVTDVDSCSGKLTVSDTAGFKAGAPVLLIQMQGVDIVTGNNFLYGIIQNMNYAGRYERAVIDSVGQNAIFVQNRLIYAYDIAGKLQLVSIPQFANAVVTDTLRCQPWNGATGGVLAFDVAGTLTLNAPVVADGAGFRGGAAFIGPGNNCNFLIPETDYYYAAGNWRGAYKGEGLALPETGKELGRGPQATGGGGGNDHNAGGGGGANMTDGGNGGANDEPAALGCDGYYPGVRGYGAFFSAYRMFAGGGGGAGHANNTLISKGGGGGGIIVIDAGDINGSVPIISADGLAAPTVQGDGAGGGGGGGSIWLKANSAPANLVARANGGQGGDTQNNNQNRCFGPGGGGSGGRILTNLPGIPAPFGGQAGKVTNSTNSCNGTSNGADNGDAGLAETLTDMPQGTDDYDLPEILAAPSADTVCSGETAVFTVEANAGDWDFQWQQNDGSGWQDLAGGPQFSGFLTDSLTVTNVAPGQDSLRFRCRVLRAGCYETVSAEALLNVENAPVAAFTNTVNGLTVNFTNQSSGTAYFWDFGDGATSQAANPQHTYAMQGTFTVTLYAINSCDTAVATQTISTLLAPAAGFTFTPPPVGCGQVQVAFTNTSSPNATAFSWSFQGGSPATSTLQNPVVTWSASGTYNVRLIASNAAGKDTAVQAVSVAVLPYPLANFIFFIQPDGTVQFADQSLNATSLLWDFGDGSTSGAANPLHTYALDGNYTVTLTVWNGCDTVSIQKTVAAFFPPAAGFFIQDTVTGCQSASVDFENTSSPNAAAFNWSFPGGTPLGSTDTNPVVSYTLSGTYTARLIVANVAGADTLEQTFYVQILDFPTAGFSYTPLGGGLIRFTNTSAQATGYTWDFGDGTPQQSGPEFDHQYAANGVYTVTLIATNACGVSVLQQTIEVLVSGVASGGPQGLGRVLIFPNPANERLTVDCSEAGSQPVDIQVFDAGGRLVLSRVDDPGLVNYIAVGGLQAGTYQVRIRFEKGVLVRAVVKG